MENYNNPNSTYNQNIWSENSRGYHSGYDMPERENSDKKGPEMSYSEKSSYQKAGSRKQMSEKENGLGKRISEIYDNQNHPFCFGTGISSSF